MVWLKTPTELCKALFGPFLICVSGLLMQCCTIERRSRSGVHRLLCEISAKASSRTFQVCVRKNGLTIGVLVLVFSGLPTVDKRE